jgi:sialate O-acetylesterase
VAYHFARELVENKGIAVGILSASVGSTKAELWISEKNSPPLNNITPNKRGVKKGPGFHYNAMIHPLIPFACQGVIWYQGESNNKDMERYEDILKTLILDWRSSWDDELKFLIVQLAGFEARDERQFEGSWARTREAQQKATELPSVDIATAIDLGERKDIHPQHKKDVGARLSLLARHMAYQENDIVFTGPSFKTMSIKNNKIIIEFENIGSGLVLKDQKLTGFYLSSDDQNFCPAQADLKNGKVILWSDKVTSPKHVRYGFSNFPNLSLYNKEGLPCFPFRTDSFPFIPK